MFARRLWSVYSLALSLQAVLMNAGCHYRRKGLHVEVKVDRRLCVLDTGVRTNFKITVPDIREVNLWCSESHSQRVHDPYGRFHFGNDAGVWKGVIGHYGEANLNSIERILQP